VTYYISV